MSTYKSRILIVAGRIVREETKYRLMGNRVMRGTVVMSIIRLRKEKLKNSNSLEASMKCSSATLTHMLRLSVLESSHSN